MLSVRVHVLSPCGRSGEVRGRHSITFRSRGTRWRRAEGGTVSDSFRLLGRIWVFLLVLCHAKCPCACFEPLWAVRGGQGSTCCHFLEPSNKKGLLMPYCDDGEENEDEDEDEEDEDDDEDEEDEDKDEED